MEFLKKLNDTNLKTIVSKFDKEFDFNNKGRAKLVREIVNNIHILGLKHITQNIPKLDLKEICNKEGIPVTGSRIYYITTINNEIMTKTPKKWFLECQQNTLKAFLDANNITTAVKNTAIKELMDRIEQYGAELLLSDLEVKHIHSICEDMNIQNHNKTNNRNLLITAIVRKIPIDLQKVLREKPIQKVTPRIPIEQCTKYNELFQHYFLSDMREYCKNNGLSPTGKKSALIRRILNHTKSQPPPKKLKNIVSIKQLFPSLNPEMIAALQREEKNNTEDQIINNSYDDDGDENNTNGVDNQNNHQRDGIVDNNVINDVDSNEINNKTIESNRDNNNKNSDVIENITKKNIVQHTNSRRKKRIV